MSRGMICSDDELGLASERAEGIMILESTWDESSLESMIGKSFFDLTLPFPGRGSEIYHYTLRDTTFEIDNKFITNRPDLFSVVGNAREFGAVFDIDSFAKELSGAERKTEDFAQNIPGKNPPPYGHLLWKGGLNTQIETKNCLSYHLMKMTNITVRKSPWGMSLMMQRAGLAPKMDIVDITNLVMTELGQPMHAFDADKIFGDICVRQANS